MVYWKRFLYSFKFKILSKEYKVGAFFCKIPASNPSRKEGDTYAGFQTPEGDSVNSIGELLRHWKRK